MRGRPPALRHASHMGELRKPHFEQRHDLLNDATNISNLGCDLIDQGREALPRRRLGQAPRMKMSRRFVSTGLLYQSSTLNKNQTKKRLSDEQIGLSPSRLVQFQ